MIKKVCYFGSFAPSYSRNKILIKGLELNDVKVTICNDQSSLGKRYLHLFKNFVLNQRGCDAIVVGVTGHYDVPLAWLLAKIFQKKLIFDAFISLYDTYVNDRGIIKSSSLAAKKSFFWDYLSCHLADLVLLDTNHHSQYFIKTFKLSPKKVKTIYIGADDEMFSPALQKIVPKSKKFIVEFHGSFQPLQGVEYIIEAANLLKDQKDIIFEIIGDGQTKSLIIKKIKKYHLKNVKLYPFAPLKKIKQFMTLADICLGIFGNSGKANRVIPNKGYETIAMQKPLVTMNSLGSAELFEDKKNALLVDNNDPNSLAQAILALKTDPMLYQKVAMGGYRLFKGKLTPKILGKRLKQIINSQSPI